MRGVKAFSLIELLVVITIVALLLSIMLPALGRSREVARQTLCAGNMRQCGLGMFTYASDYNRHLPTYYVNSGTETISTAREWYLFYTDYLTTVGLPGGLAENRKLWNVGRYVKVFDCPTTTQATNYGYMSTTAKTFDYRRMQQFSAYTQSAGVFTGSPAAGARILSQIDSHKPDMIMLVDSPSKMVPRANVNEYMDASEQPEYARFPSFVSASWYYLNGSTRTDFAIPPSYATGVTWQSTQVGESQWTSMGTHHSRGANILTPDGATRWFPVRRYLPRFEGAASSTDLIRLPPQRSLTAE